MEKKIIGRRIHRFESLGSTNDLARSLILTGAEDGEVIIAATQSRGRGRRGKEWISCDGGLWFSIILIPYNLGIEKISLFSLAIALGITQAIEEETYLKPLIKWPNDLYLNNKKLGGILIETNISLNRVNWAIVGIGINVNIDKENIPKNATSIKEELKRDVPLECLFSSILDKINKIYLNIENISELVGKIKERCLSIGKEGMFEDIRGRAIDIDKGGRLVVETEDGRINLSCN